MGRVLHGSYSGYFPFCLNEYDLDPPFPAYDPVSLETAMRIWWRIKKFRFYGTYTPGLFPLSGTRNWELVAERNANSEQELVCNKSPNWIITSHTGAVDGGFGIGDMPAFKYEEEGEEQILYILNFGFGIRFLDGTEEQGLDYTSIFETSAAGVYNFEGVDLYNTQFLDDPNATINHEILEYWSYGGIYNTSTGEPL